MLLSKKLPHQLFPRFFPCLLVPVSRHHFSTAAAIARRKPSTAPSPPPAAAEPHLLVRCLVETCGFSKSKAAEVSKRVLSSVKSTENPGAVISFLKEQGFSKDHIRQVVSAEPSVLCASVSGALEPKIRALKDAGLSRSDIPTLFSTRPRAFRVSDLAAKVRFWATLFDSKDKLLKAILKNRNIIFSSLDEKMKPNVSILYEFVESKHRVTKMISRKSQLLTANTDFLRKAIKLVENLGISTSSGLFDRAIYALIENSAKTFDAKFDLLKSFGWSESDFFSAIRRNPKFLGSSEKKIQSIMDFLLKDVECEPSYVAERPAILTFSLEGRMMPRHQILRTLSSNGLIGEAYDFSSVAKMPEKIFLKRYVLWHGEKALELYQSYIAACTKGDTT